MNKPQLIVWSIPFAPVLGVLAGHGVGQKLRLAGGDVPEEIPFTAEGFQAAYEFLVRKRDEMQEQIDAGDPVDAEEEDEESPAETAHPESTGDAKVVRVNPRARRR
jgi:hypothetical protein